MSLSRLFVTLTTLATPALMALMAFLALGLLAVGSSLPAHAQSLGPIVVKSALGQPLRAEVPIQGVGAEEMGTTSVRLAPVEAYKSSPSGFNSALTGVRVDVVQTAPGRWVARVQGDRTVSEPYFDLILDLVSSRTTLRRTYAVLVDTGPAPAIGGLQPPPTPAAAAAAATPAPTVDAARTARRAEPTPTVRPTLEQRVEQAARNAPSTSAPPADAALQKDVAELKALKGDVKAVATPPAPKPAAASTPSTTSAAASRAAAPAQDAIPERPAPPPETGSDLVLWGGAVGALAVVAVGLGWALRRSRRTPAAPKSHPVPSEAAAPPPPAPPPVVAPQPPKPPTFERPPAPAYAGPETTFVKLDATASGGKVDPIAEADVYMAYGRDLEAEQIIRAVLPTAGDKWTALTLKLMEIQSRRRDVIAFEAAALEMHERTGGAGAAWAQVQTMGAELDPLCPLYKPGGTPEDLERRSMEGFFSDPGPLTGSGVVSRFSAAASLPEVGSTPDLDLDLDLGAAGEPAGASAMPVFGAPAAPPVLPASAPSVAPGIAPAEPRFAPATPAITELPEIGFAEFEPPAPPTPPAGPAADSASAPDVSALVASSGKSRLDNFDFGNLSLEPDEARPSSTGEAAAALADAPAVRAEPVTEEARFAAHEPDAVAERSSMTPAAPVAPMMPTAPTAPTVPVDRATPEQEQMIRMARDCALQGDKATARVILSDVLETATGATAERVARLLSDLG